jgi:DNA invertase Pin-like site-specific DNA recombinase
MGELLSGDQQPGIGSVNRHQRTIDAPGGVEHIARVASYPVVFVSDDCRITAAKAGGHVSNDLVLPASDVLFLKRHIHLHPEYTEEVSKLVEKSARTFPLIFEICPYIPAGGLPPMKKRVALYLRVSSLDQHPKTLYDLRQTATLRGYQIVKEYADRNSAAKGKHPNLDQLISDARSGSCDVIMVGPLSDVACSVKQCLLVLDQLNQLGIGFVSCQPDIDTTGELCQGMVVMVHALSQLQRTLVGQAVKAGMRRSRLEGVRLGRAPLDVNRAEIVKDRALGLSLTDVARKHGVSRGLVCRIVKLAGGRVKNVTPCPSEAAPSSRATYPTLQVPAVDLSFPCASAES